MKIAMLISRYPPVLGGSEIQCQRLSQALQKRGHSVTVLTEKVPGALNDGDDQGVQVVRLGHAGGPRLLQAIHYFVDIIHYLNTHPAFDILHVHLISTAAIAALWHGRNRRIPVLIKAAGARATGDVGTSRQSWRGRLKLRLFRRWATSVVCPTEEINQELQKLPLSENILHIIPNGIDTDQWTPLSPDQRDRRGRELGLGTGPWLVCASRWAEGKGLDSLIQFFTTQAQNVRWKFLLLVAVSSKEKHRVSQQAQALPASIRLILDPPQVQPYVQCADAAILLSEGEGLSNFLLESMAVGLPVLCSEASTPQKSAAEPEWGWIIHTQKDWRAELLSWMKLSATDPGLLAKKGTAARHFVEAHYGMKGVVMQYETLYQKIQCL